MWKDEEIMAGRKIQNNPSKNKQTKNNIWKCRQMKKEWQIEKYKTTPQENK